MVTKTETAEIVGKMVSGLQRVSSDYALGYLETFIADLVNTHVTDPVELEKLRLRMLMIGIDGLCDAIERKVA
jgi:hypothetical protein